VHQSRHSHIKVATTCVTSSAVAAAPYGLVFVHSAWDPTSPGRDSVLVAMVLFLSSFFGPMVFALLSGARPDWLWGVGFGLLCAVAAGVVWGWAGRTGLATAVVLFLLSFIIGLAGAGLGVVVSRPVLREGRRHRFKPWHLGGAVAFLELVLVAAFAFRG
jgi:hypothetical protein